MDDKKRKRMIALGVVTFFPLIFWFGVVILAVVSAFGNAFMDELSDDREAVTYGDGAAGDGQAADKKPSFSVPIYLAVVNYAWLFLLFLGYTIHLLKYREISIIGKIFWILGLLVLGKFIAPAYWYRYLWCRDED